MACYHKSSYTLSFGHISFCHIVWYRILSDNSSFADLHRWHDWLDIPATLPLAVLARPGYSRSALGGPAALRFAGRQLPSSQSARLADMAPPAWCFIPMPLWPESSTEIRRRRHG